MPSESILQAVNLSRSATLPNGSALSILDDVSFTFPSGSTIAVVGASGSGKTTLLSLMAGLQRPSTGEVWLCGHPLHSLREEERTKVRRDNLAFIFQSFHLLPALTALENVMLPIEVMGQADGRRQSCIETLEMVGLGERINAYPATLSGGEQQRVAIARAFAQKPRVLFADEPTGNLDTATGEQVAEILMLLNREQGVTLMLVSHDERLASRCDHSLRLQAGRVVSENGL